MNVPELSASRPFATVIIVNWNSWQYLFPCLDALYRQTFQDFDVIVVDNASADRAPVSRLDSYPRLSCLLNERNTGFAAANNLAIRRAAGEWVFLLNPDTIVESSCLQRLYDGVRLYPQYSFFGCRLLMASDPGRLDGVGDVYHMSGLCWRAGHGCETGEAPPGAVEIFSPCAAAAMYRRDDLLAAGGFDEDFFCYNEDVDLGFRLRLMGRRALSLPDAVVLHHGSGTTGVRSDFAVYHGHRNLVWTWFKDMPLVLLLLFLPVHLLYTVACIILYRARGQGRVVLRAKVDAWKGVPAMLKKRRRIGRVSRSVVVDLWKRIDRSFIIGPRTQYRKKW